MNQEKRTHHNTIAMHCVHVLEPTNLVREYVLSRQWVITTDAGTPKHWSKDLSMKGLELRPLRQCVMFVKAHRHEDATDPVTRQWDRCLKFMSRKCDGTHDAFDCALHKARAQVKHFICERTMWACNRKAGRP